jgi:hypothetical protein
MPFKRQSLSGKVQESQTDSIIQPRVAPNAFGLCRVAVQQKPADPNFRTTVEAFFCSCRRIFHTAA